MLFVGQNPASRTTIRIAAAAAGRIHFLHTISVGREHIKLDADPQHQRHAEYAAQHHTGMLFANSGPAAVRFVRPFTISSAQPEKVKS